MNYRTFVPAAALGVVAAGVAPAPLVAADRTPTYAAYIVDAVGTPVGTATFVGVDTGGVLVRIDTKGLKPGRHGMHIHQTGSCNALVDTAGQSTPFGAAGAHFDPQGTTHHAGPSGSGHAGDLPNLVASDVGHARTTFYTDRLSVVAGSTNIVGRAIVIHASEDNYTDEPPNGGSGGRVECGEIGPLRS